MYEIRIDLAHCAQLNGMAAPAPGAGMAALPGAMFPGAGIYMIVNTNTNTRYAGIATGVVARFTARMRVVNELGMAAANMAGIWAWWGRVRTRTIPTPPLFPNAMPAFAAGRPMAEGYGVPGAAPVPTPFAVFPLTVGNVNLLSANARAAYRLPIDVAVWAYQAWTASPVPRTPATILANWPGPLPMPAGVAAAVAPAASGNAAAVAAATQVMAPLPIAVQAAAAIDGYTGVAGMAPASGVRTVVHTHFAGPPLAAILGAPVPVARAPVGGGGAATTLTDAGMNLEHVFIRFVRDYLLHPAAPPGFVANGVHIAPMPWPALAHPICVTWRSAAGGPFAAHSASVMWWPGTAF